MPSTRSARPVAKPVAGSVCRAKKSPAKKAARKRAAKKSRETEISQGPETQNATPRSRSASRPWPPPRWSSVPSRSRSIRSDEAARAAIAKRQVRGRRSAVDRLDDPPPAIGLALVERVTSAVERELSQIEVIVGGSHVNRTQRTEAERRARTLASLARTLTEVRKLRAEEEELKPQDETTSPRDIEQFRLELARKTGPAGRRGRSTTF